MNDAHAFGIATTEILREKLLEGIIRSPFQALSCSGQAKLRWAR